MLLPNDVESPARMDHLVPQDVLELLNTEAAGAELRNFRQDVKKAVVAVLAWKDERTLAVNCQTEHQATVVRGVGELLRKRMRSSRK